MPSRHREIGGNERNIETENDEKRVEKHERNRGEIEEKQRKYRRIELRNGKEKEESEKNMVTNVQYNIANILYL